MIFSNKELEVNIRDTDNDKDTFSSVIWNVKNGRQGIRDYYAYYLYRPNINNDVDEMIDRVVDNDTEIASYSSITGDGRETAFDMNDYYDFMNKGEGYRIVSTTIFFKDDLTENQLKKIAEELSVQFEDVYGKNVYYSFNLRVMSEEWFAIHEECTKEYKNGNGALYSDLYSHINKSQEVIREYYYKSPDKSER